MGEFAGSASKTDVNTLFLDHLDAFIRVSNSATHFASQSQADKIELARELLGNNIISLLDKIIPDTSDEESALSIETFSTVLKELTNDDIKKVVGQLMTIKDIYGCSAMMHILYIKEVLQLFPILEPLTKEQSFYFLQSLMPHLAVLQAQALQEGNVADDEDVDQLNNLYEVAYHYFEETKNQLGQNSGTTVSLQKISLN